MNTTVRAAWSGLLAALLATACQGGEAGAPAATDAQAPPQDPAFVSETERWRAQRLETLLAPDGWTSLVGLHWLELKAHYVGSGSTNGIRLARGPEKLGLLQQEGGRVYLVPERGVAMTVADAPVRGRIELLSDKAATPTLLSFDDGAGQLGIIERGARKAVRVKHADAPTRTAFRGIDHWPADARWRVNGRFVAHPAGKTLDIADIIGTLQKMPNPGAVEFEHGGVRHRLEALEGEAGGLFLILADRTSGHASYGAGRYLDTEAPRADGTVVLDFNRAYNPPCAFTSFATCPLPPPENRLDLAIEAGEKRYRPGG